MNIININLFLQKLSHQWKIKKNKNNANNIKQNINKAINFNIDNNSNQIYQNAYPNIANNILENTNGIKKQIISQSNKINQNAEFLKNGLPQNNIKQNNYPIYNPNDYTQKKDNNITQNNQTKNSIKVKNNNIINNNNQNQNSLMDKQKENFMNKQNIPQKINNINFLSLPLSISLLNSRKFYSKN